MDDVEFLEDEENFIPTTEEEIEESDEPKVIRIVDDVPTHDFGDIYIVPELQMEMKKVLSGSFYMGSDDGPYNERPRHRVNMTRNLWMGIYPVLQREYAEIMDGKNPSNFPVESQEDGSKFPVEKVSWTAANEFCKRLTKIEREAGRLPEPYVYRLPTEAEWEYTCRAGRVDDLIDDIDHTAWFFKNSNEQSHEVGLKEPNNWGFFDMQGNVFEWCLDCCDFREPSWYEKGNVLTPIYKNDVINPYHKGGSNRVAKGGCWLLAPDVCRPSARYINPPDSRYFVMGFRIVLAEPALSS
ncbi:MAG: formylglycine-generating enzyme family protein [Lentisphaerales bacterium]|nr:formylglycine-generating enzyme family protein [Lentisphaerales bacterium]